MPYMKKRLLHRILHSFLLMCMLSVTSVSPVYAVGSPEPQQSGTTGMQGTIPSPPPKTAATISSPVSGRVFTSIPITITGLCTTGLLVKVFSNNIFIGSVMCERGSYSITTDLFSGQNELIARVYDALDQTGPDSSKVVVTFQDSTFAAFGQRVSLTSNVAKAGAPVGSPLVWSIILSGGSGPYAISVDWGDGSATDLKSLTFAGPFNIQHTYNTAGIYRVVVKATDKGGTSAYLQLVGMGNGPVTQKNGTTGTDDKSIGDTKLVYIWWPVLLLIPFAVVAFVIGRKFELVSIHRRLEKQAAIYQNEIQR